MQPITTDGPPSTAFRRTTLLLAAVLVLSSQALRGEEPPDDPSQLEERSYQLLEILKTAGPPPLPPSPVYSDVESRSAEHSTLVSRDLVSAVEEVLEPSAASGTGTSSAESLSTAPQVPQLLWDADRGRFVEPLASVRQQGVPEDQLAGSCTPPSPFLFTHSFPWNTVYKLLMRFNSGGTDYFYVCSAASMGSFHLLTAGHCIYNHDPNGDGNTADAAWADEVWAWAAQTDLTNPFFGHPQDADWPYSFAKSVRLVSYNGWINSADLNHDMGYITLDRRKGDQTGWMGREADVATSALNFNGYPSETPYVVAGERRQHPGFDAGNVTSTTTFRINMCAYVYGGHSGGPDWRFDGVNSFIQGVNSTSDRSGNATATRLTSDKFNDINTVIAEDEAVRPPISRPDLAELQFTTSDDLKDLTPNAVASGGSFQVEYSVLNAGFASTGTVTVDFYLSTNNLISTGDFLVGTRTLSSLPPFTFSNPTTTLTASVPPGTYFVGWIMSSAVPEYGGDQTCSGTPCTNVVVIADETLTVTAPTCTVDGWEPDGSAGTASLISSGVPQNHSICGVGDDDWVTFTLGAATHGWQITLGTSGPGPDDTRLWLYDSGLGEIEFDDDDGPGLYSNIGRSCGFEALAPGTYYARVDEFDGDEEIDAYVLELTTSPCPSTLFTDGFESGNTSAWTNTVP